MANEVEKWKPVIGYEENYLVSSNGRIMNAKTGKIKVCPLSNNGYKRVELWKGDFGRKYLVHKLVAQAFIPNYDNKPCINHKDHNRANNSVENLEWVTNSENQLHRYAGGRCESKGGENTRISVKCVENGKIFYSISEAEREVERADRKSIKLVLEGKRKTSGGYHWEVAEDGE